MSTYNPSTGLLDVEETPFRLFQADDAIVTNTITYQGVVLDPSLSAIVAEISGNYVKLNPAGAFFQTIQSGLILQGDLQAQDLVSLSTGGGNDFTLTTTTGTTTGKSGSTDVFSLTSTGFTHKLPVTMDALTTTASGIKFNDGVPASTTQTLYYDAGTFGIGAGLKFGTLNISDLFTRMSTAEGTILTNTGNINTNTTNIATNTSNISTNTSNISTNTSNISTNTSNISTNTSNISTNTSNISTNTSNISTNASDITTIKGAGWTSQTIKGNADNIATNTTNISTNTTAIAGKVSKSGDTMTGNLTIDNPSPQIILDNAFTSHVAYMEMRNDGYWYLNVRGNDLLSGVSNAINFHAAAGAYFDGNLVFSGDNNDVVISKTGTSSKSLRLQAGDDNSATTDDFAIELIVRDSAASSYTAMKVNGKSQQIEINRDLTIDDTRGVIFEGSTAPSTTTNKLYRSGSDLYWNGTQLGGGGGGTTDPTFYSTITLLNDATTNDYGLIFAAASNASTTGEVGQIRYINSSVVSTDYLSFFEYAGAGTQERVECSTNMTISGTLTNTELQNATSNIATNTSNIATNTSNIATNTSNISTNTSNISTNTSNISTNTSNISTNTSNISTLDTNKYDKSGGTITGNVTLQADFQTDTFHLPETNGVYDMRLKGLGNTRTTDTTFRMTSPASSYNFDVQVTDSDYILLKGTGTFFHQLDGNTILKLENAGSSNVAWTTIGSGITWASGSFAGLFGHDSSKAVGFDYDDGTFLRDGTQVSIYTNSNRVFRALPSNGTTDQYGDISIYQQQKGTSPAYDRVCGGLRFLNSYVNSTWALFGNDADDFNFNYNGSNKSYLNNTGSDTQLNFTGLHRSVVNDNITSDWERYVGLLVETTGEYNNIFYDKNVPDARYTPNVREALPCVRLTSKLGSKAVFGVLHNKEKLMYNNTQRSYNTGGFVGHQYDIDQADSVEMNKRYDIASVGESAVWIIKTAGWENPENGDLFMSSDKQAGYGQIQPDGVVKNITAGKLTCSWDNPKLKTRQIGDYTAKLMGCVLYCG